MIKLMNVMVSGDTKNVDPKFATGRQSFYNSPGGPDWVSEENLLQNFG